MFNKQIAAHIAAQMLTHHEPFCMSDSLKYFKATPKVIIWKNLAMNPYKRCLWQVISVIVGVILLIGWTIPGKPHLNPVQPTS